MARRGRQMHKAQLSPDAERRLLRAYLDASITMKDITTRFGCGEETVHRIAASRGIPRVLRSNTRRRYPDA